MKTKKFKKAIILATGNQISDCIPNLLLYTNDKGGSTILDKIVESYSLVADHIQIVCGCDDRQDQIQ